MNWTQRIIETYAENEAPEKFFYWAALTAMSAVVRKNVSLNRYHYRLYPNIYTFLVASSGMKKGVPVTIAKKLVEKANCTRIISGRNSVQRIIQDLGKAFSLEGGGVIRDAQGFLVSGELAAFFVKDPDALTILTDIYDTHAYEEFWINSLKSTDVDKLRSPCLTLLGATNEDHFAEAVPNSAVGGGFIARTFIVLSTEKGTPNALTRPPSSIPDLDDLALYLKELSQVKGEFSWTPEGMQLYEAWYYEHIVKKYHDPTGTMNRLGDQVLKAAMLISLADNFELQLTQQHIFEAITVCEACITGMQQVTMGSGSQNLAQGTKVVIRELIMNPTHQIEKAKLLASIGDS